MYYIVEMHATYLIVQYNTNNALIAGSLTSFDKKKIFKVSNIYSYMNWLIGIDPSFCGRFHIFQTSNSIRKHSN